MTFGKSLLALAIATTLTACGGSDSGSDVAASDTPDTAPPAEQSPSDATVVEGVVTGFGSVYVNGKRYVSDGAAFTISGKSGAQESGLKMGMVVRVLATQSEDGTDPQATEIVYEETLQGEVSAIDNANARFTVAGQNVYFDDLTEFDEIDAQSLSVGDRVEVSGYATEDGFYATFVKLETEDLGVKLTGAVSSLDTDQKTFMIGQQLIDYSQATFDDMVVEDLADGLMVKVEGALSDDTSAVLVATEIENNSDDDTDDLGDIDDVDIAGVVTSYDEAAGTFKVNRYDFVLSDETEFEDGDRADFAQNIWVNIEGSRVEENWVAEKVEFKKRDSNTKTEGTVTSVDTDSQAFVVNGITFVTDGDTQYEDESELEERRFTFDDILVNDLLKIASREAEDGTVVALKVKRIDEDDREGKIKGNVMQATAEGMTVAGVQVTFTQDTEFESRDDMTLEDFLTYVEQNNAVRVKVEGDYSDTSLVAEEVKVMPSKGKPGNGSDDADDDDSDSDEADNTDVSMEGQVEAIGEQTITVNGYELQFDESSELEINDETVDVQTFIAALEVGTVVEFEGTLTGDSVVLVDEAETETQDDTEEG